LLPYRFLRGVVSADSKRLQQVQIDFSGAVLGQQKRADTRERVFLRSLAQLIKRAQVGVGFESG
jgi:hypothetical protein